MQTKADKKSDVINATGAAVGNVEATNYMVDDVDRFVTPRGHGYAAEQMNDYWDKVHGHDAKVVGGNNAKDGADRIVDGIEIQTKYCKTGSKCVGECFEKGRFRYINSAGKPMQIEVPSDKYDDAVKAMESRIKRGEVPGITNPKEAKNIIRKGNFTYEQARNVARFGTVESITLDAANGTIVASYAFGISTAMNFAVSVWNGKPFDEALKNSASAGLKVGGAAFVTTVLSSQMQRTALNSLLRGSTDQIVKLMGPKASAYLANAFRSGANLSGAAAMQSASKILRGNAITGAITVAVLSTFDVANLFRGRISGKQLFKNVSKTAATVAGGTGGWMAGASAGAAIGSVVPGLGTAIGGIAGGLIGSLAGGSAAGKVSSAVLDGMIEDDAVKMQGILEQEFKQLAEDYLITPKEAEKICDRLSGIVDGDFLKKMFASESRRSFANKRMLPLFEDVAKKRQKIFLPSEEDMVQGLKSVLNDVVDHQESEKLERTIVKNYVEGSIMTNDQYYKNYLKKINDPNTSDAEKIKLASDYNKKYFDEQDTNNIAYKFMRDNLRIELSIGSPDDPQFEAEEFIKALNIISSSVDGKIKIMQLLNVLMKSAEDILPVYPEEFETKIKRLEESIDDIIRYGIDNNLITDSHDLELESKNNWYVQKVIYNESSGGIGTIVKAITEYMFKAEDIDDYDKIHCYESEGVYSISCHSNEIKVSEISNDIFLVKCSKVGYGLEEKYNHDMFIHLEEYMEKIGSNKCPVCGEEIVGKGKFCANCGATL